MCRDHCRNWYAVQTLVGHESKLCSTIHRLNQGIEYYLPSREVIHTIKGKPYLTRLPLFPGYIFVHNHIEKLIETLDKSRSSILARPVKANGHYLEARGREMALLFNMAGKEGVIGMSKGVMTEHREVKITNGPLKQLKGKILFVNPRKNKAKARIEIMNRSVDVSLGLEILSP